MHPNNNSSAKNSILWVLSLLLIGGSAFLLLEIDKIRSGILTESDLNKMVTLEADTPLLSFEASSAADLVNTKVNQQTNIESASDVLVACQIHENCGGGVIGLKRNVCQNATCCQIGSSWLFYTDKEKCVTDQKNYRIQLEKQMNQAPADNQTQQQTNYEAKTDVNQNNSQLITPTATDSSDN